MPAKKKGGAVRPDGYYDSQGFLKDSQQDKQFMGMNPARKGQYLHFVDGHPVKDGVGVKGSKSKTHKGDLNYTTKKGDKDFHEDGHLVKKTYKPFDAHKGSVSKTHAGLDFQHYNHHLKLPIRGGGYLKINICHESDSDSDMEGEGLWDDAKDAFKRAGNKIKDTASNVYNKAKDIANKVITGDTGMPPNVKKILDQYGNELISSIDIVRNPVGKASINWCIEYCKYGRVW